MAEAPVGPIARSVAVLQMLAEVAAPVSIADAAKFLDLPRSTVHRFLQHLVETGMVSYDARDRRYGIGVEFQRLAGLVAGSRDTVAIARPYMEDVTAATNETCLLAAYRPPERDMVFIGLVESSHALRFHIPLNAPLPLVWGCSGRVMLAHLDHDVLAEILAMAEPSPVSGAAPPALAALERDVLPSIRERGYDATRSEKIAESFGLAAPVFGRGSRIFGSLAVSIPLSRLGDHDVDAVAELVTTSAARLGNALGGA